MLQNNELPQVIFSIKIGTLVAGLLGALVTLLRKSEGSLQARLFGFVAAIATITYLVPFLLWFAEYRFALVLAIPAENFCAFVSGLLSQTIVESFIDNPTETVFGWLDVFTRIKGAIAGTGLSKAPNKIFPDETEPGDKKEI